MAVVKNQDVTPLFAAVNTIDASPINGASAIQNLEEEQTEQAIPLTQPEFKNAATDGVNSNGYKT